MARWPLEIALEPESDLPVFVQIARSIIDDVRRGRLRPGALMPGSRPLADAVGVHRNTVLAAYRELLAEGWLITRPTRGTYVNDTLPDLPGRAFARNTPARAGIPDRCGFALGGYAPSPRGSAFPKGVIALWGGVPDTRFVPVDALARAYRRALRSDRGRVLNYGDPRGHPGLRRALAQMLSARRGLAAREDHVLVTRGSQMAIDLAARALVAPGECIAVEAYGYRPAWDAFRAAGAKLIPVPVDAQGLQVDRLARCVASQAIRAVYVTAHHQYPTTVTLSPARRIALLDLAHRHGFAVLEDDYDHEFHYEGRPVLPMASADRHGVVIYLGTMSKLLAPGLRIGFMVGPTPWIERCARLRERIDRQGDHAVEGAVAELIEDGEVQRHARRVRLAYRARRDVLMEAIGTELSTALTVTTPAGGLALWGQVDGGIDADAWAARAVSEGVGVFAAKEYAFDGRSAPCLRLGFAAVAERDLREAVRRLARALRDREVTVPPRARA